MDPLMQKMSQILLDFWPLQVTYFSRKTWGRGGGNGTCVFSRPRSSLVVAVAQLVIFLASNSRTSWCNWRLGSLRPKVFVQIRIGLWFTTSFFTWPPFHYHDSNCSYWPQVSVRFSTKSWHLTPESRFDATFEALRSANAWGLRAESGVSAVGDKSKAKQVKAVVEDITDKTQITLNGHINDITCPSAPLH